MADDTWGGASGSWNYGPNWSSGTAPLSGQSAVVVGQAPETITGSGYFEDLKVEAAQVTISGDFEAFDDAATISDAVADQGSGTGTVSSSQTLIVSPWGDLVAGQVALDHTDVAIQGGFLVGGGYLQAVTVSGGEGFLGVDTDVQVNSLTVLGGALASGNMSIDTGGAIKVDDQSSLGNGTLSAMGLVNVGVQSTGSTSTYSFSNGFEATQDGYFVFSSSSDETLLLEGPVSGAGTLAFQNQTVSIADVGGFSGTFNLTSSTMLLDGDTSAGPISFILDGANLTLPQSGTSQPLQAAIVCSGASDTVSAGAAVVNVSATGTAALSFIGGVGAATVRGGAGSLRVVSGSGNTTVGCGTGSNIVTVGGGQDAVYGSSGASISIIKGGQTTVTAGTGSETIDATGSTGNNTFVGGSGGGTTTIRGGTGSSVMFGMQGTIYAVGGTGDLVVSGSTSGKDTLIGGSGDNLIFARSTGTQVHGSGAGTNVLVAITGGVYLDASNCSGNATLFAGGGTGGVTTLAGGSGSDVIATPNGNASVIGGSGSELIWGGISAADTIDGGTGNTTMVGGAGSQMQLDGSANDVVVSFGGGATVNAAEFTGNAVIWTAGIGTSNVICGAGSETVVAGSGTLHAIGGTGFSAIWGGNSGHDTIIGGQGINALFGQSGAYLQSVDGSTNYMEASGSNVTLNGAASGGWEHLVDTNGSSGTVIYTGRGVSDVQALGASDAIHVVGGEVTLECGLGLDSIWLDSSSISGTLNVFGFDVSKDRISAPAIPNVMLAGISASIGIGDTTLTFGNETIILHGSIPAG